MAVKGIAIHTGEKCPLKRDVRISEVWNSGVPLYMDMLVDKLVGKDLNISLYLAISVIFTSSHLNNGIGTVTV